ncbi:MAG: sulfite exporter TauE/SafE family protein [bacterium]|nr:sulfite exporter TauE/SafE family protein [bacterium]
MSLILYIALGLITGIISGLLGIGGGIIVIPALVYIFKMSQHQAQGTTLAFLVLPIGLLAALVYYKQGYVDIKAAMFICIGFFIGGLFGAKMAIGIPDIVLRKIFAVALLLTSVKMFFSK